MEHDNETTTTMISTQADQQERQKEDMEFDSAPNLQDDSDDEAGQMLEEDETIQKLDSFDKLGRSFVRSLSLTVEDVGASDNYRQVLLDVADHCFSNIIRLSNTVTGC